MSAVSERLFHDAEPLAVLLEELRADSGPVVLANGCFDLIHVGHIRYLEGAASLGGILVVALNDDRSTRDLKGEGRPLFPQSERAEILLALRYVDYVLLFGDRTVDRILRTLKPDFHAKGTDYTVDSVPEIETSRAIGCETVIVGDPKDHSSSEIITRIQPEE